MGLQIFLGSACVAVLVAGSFGFRYAIPVVALAVVGLGVKKLFDNHRNGKSQDGKVLDLDEPGPEAEAAASTSTVNPAEDPDGAAPDFNPASYLHSAGHLSRRWCRVSDKADRFDRSPL